MISGFCEEGKHGRCSGWMVVPAYGEGAEHPDISVRCFCLVCRHPRVERDHHITHPPRGSTWSSSTETPSSHTS